MCGRSEKGCGLSWGEGGEIREFRKGIRNSVGAVGVWPSPPPISPRVLQPKRRVEDENRRKRVVAVVPIGRGVELVWILAGCPWRALVLRVTMGCWISRHLDFGTSH